MKLEIGFKSGNKITFFNNIDNFREVIEDVMRPLVSGTVGDIQYSTFQDFFICLNEVEYIREVAE